MSGARAIGLLLGVLADGAIGGRNRSGPADGFARLARTAERKLYADRPVPGVLYAGGLTAGVVLIGLAAERVGRRSPLLRAVATVTATWAELCVAALAADGTELARDLETGTLEAARTRLSELDLRETAGLDTIGLSRASVEAVAENTSDVVVVPLVWGALAGIPGVLGARAVTVLVRTVGPPNRVALPPRHRRFGWFTARLDEVVSLLPTRAAAALAVAVAPVVGGSAAGSWRAWRRDTAAHPGPNAGRVEAAFAGALEVRLGGRTAYRHGTEELPVLGDGRNPDAGHVTRAVELSRVVGWLAGLSSAALALLLGPWRRRCRSPRR
ncbi:cobalamin biosynthesis protein CobD/CbiB [Amycolatopsis cihanbeyliensis]